MKVIEISKLNDNKGIIWHISFHPFEQKFITCGEDKNIRIYKQINKEWILNDIIENCHNKTIRSCEYSPNGKYF